MTAARNLGGFAAAANTNGSANGVVSGNWVIDTAGTKVNFKYNGTIVLSIDSTGNVIAKADIGAFGTP